MGAETELDESLNKMDPQTITKYLSDQGCTWPIQPVPCIPFQWSVGMTNQHDSMYPGHHAARNEGTKVDAQASHTLMPEVSTIIDTRPITTIPLDCDEPLPKTPSMLLTQKSCPLGPLPRKFVSRYLYAKRK